MFLLNNTQVGFSTGMSQRGNSIQFTGGGVEDYWKFNYTPAGYLVNLCYMRVLKDIISFIFFKWQG